MKSYQEASIDESSELSCSGWGWENAKAAVLILYPLPKASSEPPGWAASAPSGLQSARGGGEPPLSDAGWRWGFSSHLHHSGFPYNIHVLRGHSCLSAQPAPKGISAEGTFLRECPRCRSQMLSLSPGLIMPSGQISASLCKEGKCGPQNNSCATFKADQAGPFFVPAAGTMAADQTPAKSPGESSRVLCSQVLWVGVWAGRSEEGSSVCHQCLGLGREDLEAGAGPAEGSLAQCGSGCWLMVGQLRAASPSCPGSRGGEIDPAS